VGNVRITIYVLFRGESCVKEAFYIYKGGTLKRKDNTLQFVNSENQKRDIPVERVGEIYVMSEMTFNTALINFLAQKGIVVHFFNYYDFYSGSFYPRERLLSGNLLVHQTEHYIDYSKRMVIAKKFIQGAAANIYRNLRYYNGRGKDVESFMKEIEQYRKKISTAETIQELMGYEGNIRQRYYAAWSTIINQEIDFEKRVMHPPDNMINSLISYVNTLVYTKVLSEVYQTQLNPTISYLHEPGERRFSLCLDLSEIFKPLIADRLIFFLIESESNYREKFYKGIELPALNGESLQNNSRRIRDKATDNNKT